MTPGGRVQVNADVSSAVTASLDPEVARRAVEEAMRVAGRETGPAGAEVSLRITDDAEMHRLNRDYRGVDRPTDVLSFSFVADQTGPRHVQPPDLPLQLGEIAVSYPCVERQAEELGHSADMELAWLIVHGTLQLIGYGHDTDEAASRMEALEREALRSLGYLPDVP